MRILVVDDVEANLELFRLFLSREGAEVFLASGGEEALAQYQSQELDCLFLDLRMPGMDGIEVAMEIRRREVREGRRIFIAGMSGGDPGTDRMCCEAAGMDCFLQKPVTARQIQDIIERCLWKERRRISKNAEKPEIPGPPQPSLRGIHLGGMLELLRGNWELLKMAVENRFLPQIHRDLEELRSLVERGELEKAERVAHKMKGNLGYFGKNDAALLAEKVRFSCERGDLREAEHYLPPLAGRCAFLEEFFGKPNWEHEFSPQGEHQGNMGH